MSFGERAAQVKRGWQWTTSRPAIGCPGGCLLMLLFLVPFAFNDETMLVLLIAPGCLAGLLGLWLVGESIDRMRGRAVPSAAEEEAKAQAEWREFVESQEPERVTGPLGPLPNPDELELGEFIFHAAGFNVTKENADWINPGLFGEDLAEWFREQLEARGLSIGISGEEDWGWYVDVVRDGVTYTVNVSGFPELREGLPDLGEWHVHLERRRGFTDWLLRRGRLQPGDPVLAMIAELVAELAWTEG